MGLSFYVQKVEPTGIGFSYSGFDEFRHRIARSIGLKGVYSGTKTSMYKTGSYKQIETTHPMYPFIDHDDNEGELGPENCGQVGAYLKILMQEWRKELEEKPDAGLFFDTNAGEKLADVMLKCYENGETLLFV